MASPRILLVRFSSHGDVLLLTPLIRALRARHPAATLTALTKQEWAPLLSANPHLDQVATIARGQSLVPLARALRGAGYTHRLDLHASVRSRMLRLLVPGTWHGFDARRKERQALIRHPPDILITTPESLFLMLTSQARETFTDVKTVIVDEIHAMVASKRGAHLMLSLERVEALRMVSAPLQRIGLSATQRSLEEVAAFLGGRRRTSSGEYARSVSPERMRRIAALVARATSFPVVPAT